MTGKAIVDRLVEQVNLAKEELDKYEPETIDWYQRCVAAARLLGPWLIDVAPSLREDVDSLLASPRRVREVWETIKAEAAIPKSLIADMDDSLRQEGFLVQQASGTLISKIVEAHLMAKFPNRALKSNGSSDYPDLYVATFDYSLISPHTRTADSYGASIKNARPVRVPDGLEIKTIVGNGGIDCHYPHVGLHLIVILDAADGSRAARVNDVRLGFARFGSYRITTPRTKATTLKASFNSTTVRSDNFPSILGR